MNLVTDPWIPVIKLDGTPWTASLLEVFTQGQEFSDLAVRPHERIALMRLLICIGQAALDGPNNVKEWEEAPGKLPESAKQYMEKWKDRFELFYDSSDEGKKYPFLQVTWPQRTGISDKPTPVSKLDIPLAAGNNSTLFDHFGLLGEDRCFSPARTALILISFQNFAQGGGISSSVWVDKPKNYADAPCKPSSMLHSFIRMKSLYETICVNLLTKTAVMQHFGGDSFWGKPIWENMPCCFEYKPAIENATRTYLGRLVPLSRLIMLKKGSGAATMASGFEYPRFPIFPAEVSATIIVSTGKDGEERKLLSAGKKAIWRELAALIVSRKQGDSGGALTLGNIDDNASIDLWTGALVIDPRKTAEVLDAIESVLHVPAGLRTDAGRAAYDGEVHWAEKRANMLSWAVETYRKHIDGGWEGRVKTTKPQDRWALRDKLHATATRHYWTAVEKLRPLLMDYVVASGMPQQTLEQIESAAEKSQEAQALWQKAVRKAARESYTLACGQETPRQMRAFAFGWSNLVGKSKDQHAEAQSAEIEEPDMEKTEE